MRHSALPRALRGAALALALVSASAAAEDLPIGAGFDFYVLSLSWSPSFCAAEGGHGESLQCSGTRPYGFIVHGLWPQFEDGFPENCRSTEPRDVPRATVSGLLDIMPSAGLVRHQWRKHGTCSGLSQHDYFQTVRAARGRVFVPPLFRRMQEPRQLSVREVEAAFLTANPGLPAQGIAVTCDRRYLREVHICLTKDLSFRACPEVDRRACRLGRALMPAVR